MEECPFDGLSVRCEPCLGNITKRCQFIILDILAFILGKAKQEYRPLLCAISDQHTKTTRASLSGTRHPLLDHATAQIRINQPALSSPDRFAKTCIRNPLTPGEAHERLGFEYPQLDLQHSEL